MPRRKAPTLSSKAVKTAKEVMAIIAPHIPVDLVEPVVTAEAVINYAKEQADILKQQMDNLKAMQQAAIAPTTGRNAPLYDPDDVALTSSEDPVEYEE